MGKLTSIVSGVIRGKVGAFNFSFAKGINKVSAYQPEPRPSNTPAQAFQRQKMFLIVELFRKITTAISVGFRQTPNPLSPYNAFVSTNILGAMTGTTADNVEIDFAQLQTAKGNMGITPIDTLVADVSDGNAVVTWDDELEPVGSSITDTAVVTVINSTLGTATALVSNANREDGTVSVPLPEGTVAGNTIYAYLSFRSIISPSVSDSVNDSVVAIA